MSSYESSTPLALAVENGDEVIIKLLLVTENASIDSKNSESRTSLALMIKNGDEVIIKLLQLFRFV